MSFLISAILIISIAVLGGLWRTHKRAYYELEERVEKRLGSVRGDLDGVGDFALTTSGLIPHLDKIANKYGDELSSEEATLVRKSRACYYIGGFWGPISFLVIFLVVGAGS